MKTKLTVFTPSYNRAHTLSRTYESLCRQTCNEFIWLVIDDGSTDSTMDLVESWKRDGKINIQYVFKENGGLHTGYNKAIELITTELCVCIDSDDWMPDDAVDKILSFWNKYKREDVAGIMGLDFYANGEPIGGYFPNGIETLKIIDMVPKYHHKGDVKVVHRTELLKAVAPMPVFAGEKNFNPIYLFHRVDIKYPLLLLNDNLCFVEYQPDGMTNNIFNQYISSPRSFSELRKLLISRKDVSFGYKFRNAIHYVSSQIMIKNRCWLKDSPEKFITLLASPLGLLLYFYIKKKANK